MIDQDPRGADRDLRHALMGNLIGVACVRMAKLFCFVVTPIESSKK